MSQAYYPFKGEPGASIAVELFHGYDSVPNHSHAFNEFVLVLKGTCMHVFGKQRRILIPGDVFLVPAHKSHAYGIESSLTIYNVQFYPQRLDRLWGGLWDPALASGVSQGDLVTVGMQWESLFPGGEDESPLEEDPDDDLRILRLNPQERDYVSALLGYMHREQQQRGHDYERVLRSYLEIVLVELTRVQHRQISIHNTQNITNSKENAVKNAVEYIDEHLAEPIDFRALAEQSFMSVNYFRTIFKSVTGLSPIDYINRSRITKSLQLLQMEELPVSEIAARVGIHDANYFTRMFKRIIGYPPKYFKHIGE